MTEQKLREILEQKVEVPVMVDNKLKNTYAQLEGGERPAKRKGLRTVRMALLAAVLAVGCVLCMAAGLPTRVYHFFGGGGSVSVDGFGTILGVAGEDYSPIVLEDERLWFVNGGDRMDITDLVDERTPYIYEHTDPVTKEKGYVIMGGTPENFGWAEYARVGDAVTIGGNNFGQDARITLDGGDGQTDTTVPHGSTITVVSGSESPYQPWLQTAMDQLGITDH